MTRDSTVLPFQHPEEVDDPLTSVLRDGAYRVDALTIGTDAMFGRLADTFLDDQLRPELFEAACAAAGVPLTLRRHDGYDHSYYFIATFIGEHVAHHARALRANA